MMVDKTKIRQAFKKLKNQKSNKPPVKFQRRTIYLNGHRYENMLVTENDGELYVSSESLAKVHKKPPV